MKKKKKKEKRKKKCTCISSSCLRLPIWSGILPFKLHRQIHSLRREVMEQRECGKVPVSPGIVASSTILRCFNCDIDSGSLPTILFEDITRL